ncbi:MAG: hypothetical protein EOS10_00160 [Mesorhizobium sp.]|uniref:hypothetical protein n=1 Tax=Mesorhizobium sp. TaxID=1871066 RepID=UPI000FE62BD6|nr:hypothetical protein [Mesorhizobium sp.]RWO34752.1 MAG: hypothetical protein EOS10_00160 [Mesorhizobium sp.]
MSHEDDFNLFWRTYPRRISKGSARTAFEKAIRKTTLDAMLQAIADYIRFKPERIDFKHPATWLNGECWDDEWQTVPKEVTNRKRTIVDAARDRFNGRHSGAGSDADAQQFSADRRPGCDDGYLRLGDGGTVFRGHH